jgi:hypothetical protein
MKCNFSLPQQSDTIIDVEYSFWTGKLKVFANGQPVERSAQSKRKNPKYIIPGPGEIEQILEVKPSIFDGGLNVFVNGTKIPVTRPLKWYEYLMGGLPILLIFFGGAIGGLFGAIGACCNFMIIRSKLNIVVKILAVLGISAISLILYLIFALLINYAING